jgi:serine/threonine-protein kinase
MRRALAPDPADRFQRASAMRDDLAARHTRWRAQLEGTCGPLPEAVPLEMAPPQTAPAGVRATPIKSGPRCAPSQWGLDALWRPHTHRPVRFQSDSDGRTVTDPATGLTWQRGGSAFALDWHRAGEYTAQLNRDGFAGRHHWRLPTIAELITLLQPNPTGREHCLPPVFDRRPRRLWSCDRRAFTSAWYVDLDIGFVAWHDFSCQNAIKAVCSPASAPPRPQP